MDRHGDRVQRGELTEEDREYNKLRFYQQFDALSQHDREILVEVVRLQLSLASDAEEIVAQASREPEYARKLVALAQMIETVGEGKPLRENMAVHDALEVLKQHGLVPSE
jgi:hypothetical protein